MKITIERTNRKSVGFYFRGDEMLVRAPLQMTDAQIQRVIQKNQKGIDQAYARYCESIRLRPGETVLTDQDIENLCKQALQVIPERVKYYAPLVGVNYGRITIRNQRSRWGSCSSQRNLNFNCLLMLTPPEVLDSVVVHELCHLKEMNHSKRFYSEVLRVFPKYRECEKWLKENGPSLLRRMLAEAQ